MTRANQWLAFSSALSVGAGFLGGMMFSRRRTEPSAGLTSTIGRLYEIDRETYVDSTVYEFLAARADQQEQLGEWTMLRYRNFVVFIKLLHAIPIFPGQRGALYSVRHIRGDSENAANDAAVHRLLQDMIDLVLIEFAGRWRSWDDAKASMTRANRHGGLK